MPEKSETERQHARAMLGDPHPLVAQLGSASWEPFQLGATVLPPVRDFQGLRAFLNCYQGQVLVPLELPAIVRAFHHASRYEVSELIELDRQLAREPSFARFIDASRAVGRSQLRRLRPLRDQRLVQRYLKAVDQGQAHGCHHLVYGVVLAIFSLPLRQGLLSYSRQTFQGFIHSAAGSLALPETACDLLLEDLSVGLPKHVASVLADSPTTKLLVC